MTQAILQCGEERIAFSISDGGPVGYPYGQNESWWSTSFHIQKLRYLIQLNVRTKIIKLLLEESKVKDIYDLDAIKGLLNGIQKALIIKENIGKNCSSKDSIKRVGRQATEWAKVFICNAHIQ